MLRLLAFSPTMFIILNQPPHEVILRCQQFFWPDWQARWWRWSIATWGLATPTSSRFLRDVETSYVFQKLE
jgi:hypothetical protein